VSYVGTMKKLLLCL